MGALWWFALGCVLARASIAASPVTGKIVDRSTFGGSRLETGGTRSFAPRWSPDGIQIAFIRDRRLHVMNADGGG